jgi:hypothetical protein
MGLVLFASAMVNAQTFIDEHFGTFPPSGWTIDAHPNNWHMNHGYAAGGNSPEAVFDGDSSFSGMSRFISPYINLTGITTLKLQFKHFIDHSITSYSVGIATRDGHGAWHNVLSLYPTGNVGPEERRIDITTADIGADSFQLCWYYSGLSLDIDYWYIDDILLYSPIAHDVKAASIEVGHQYSAGDHPTIEAIVENIGLNIESFDIICEVLLNRSVVFSHSQTITALNAGSNENIDFSDFEIPTANELYDVIVYTRLAGDMNQFNDTAAAIFNTYTTPRDHVILEIGTGTWCSYCPGAALGADDMVENGHNVAAIEYHAGGGGDPFINSYSTARCAYYDITGFPIAFFDGVLCFPGGHHTNSMYTNYLQLFNQRQPVNTAFSIENLHASHNGNDYQIHLKAIKRARTLQQSPVLRVAVTESGIPYSWQGLSELNFVERVMTPDQNGTALDFSSSDTQIVNLAFVKNNTWEFFNLYVVAFIQNLDDKEILQGTMLPLNMMTTDIDAEQTVLPTETRLINSYPNPFNPSTKIEYSMKESNFVVMNIYNIMGQKVRTLVNSFIVAGEYSAIWDGRDDKGLQSVSGIYFVKMETGDFSSTKKLVLLR